MAEDASKRRALVLGQPGLIVETGGKAVGSEAHILSLLSVYEAVSRERLPTFIGIAGRGVNGKLPTGNCPCPMASVFQRAAVGDVNFIPFGMTVGRPRKKGRHAASCRPVSKLTPGSIMLSPDNQIW
jgi:hypothetical protein